MSELLRMALAFKQVNGQGQRPDFEIPDTCPICHHACSPEVRNVYCASLKKRAQIAFLCTNGKCRRLFVSRYVWNNSLGYELEASEPLYAEKRGFSDEITTVSPSFVSIYNQAAAAEASGLEQISGGGYRKALEFLVKDYLIAQAPDESDAIRKEFLGKSIEDRIPEGNLRQCARMATWIGNDEVHYEKRWSDKDLEDLKTLLELTIHWVQSELLTQRYSASMDRTKE